MKVKVILLMKLSQAVVFLITVCGIPSKVMAYIMENPVPSTLPLGRPGIKQVGAMGNYTANTNTTNDEQVSV
jgi:hypothetical protein